MSPCEAVSIILDADAAVTAIRADRFFLGINWIPSGNLRPYQYCDQRDENEVRHLGGRSGFADVVFELESYADDPATAIALAKASRDALDEFTDIVVNAADGDEMDFVFIKFDDEQHVAPVQIPGRERAIAVMRQSYRAKYRTTPGQ